MQWAGVAIQFGWQGEAHAAPDPEISHIFDAQGSGLAVLEAGIGPGDVPSACMTTSATSSTAMARMLGDGRGCGSEQGDEKSGGEAHGNVQTVGIGLPRRALAAYDCSHTNESDLMEQTLCALLPPARERHLGCGEALFRVGDPSLGLVVVRTGGLELIRTSAEGRRSVLHRAGPGDTFAEASVFEGHHHCDAVATALTAVEIYSATELRRAAAADPEIAWRIAAHLASRLVAERVRAERLALPHAADRLLDVLHALPPGSDGLRRLGRSWKALAAELGLSHEATYRALARLERAGILRREGSDRVSLRPAT